MENRNLTNIILKALIILAAAAAISSAADEAPRIMKEELDPDDPSIIFLDVRLSTDWKGSDRKIRGAIKVDPHDVPLWADRFPKDRMIVVYCA